jgi:hypothetical protein
MRECGHYLEMILSAQMAFEMSFRLKFAVTVSAPRTAKSQTFGVLMATTLYVLPKTDTAVARYFADLAEKVQFWFLRLTPFLAKLFELERHSLFLSNFEGAFLLWKPVQAGAQGCSNIRFGEFEFSKRQKNRFEFELPLCYSIRANLLCENSFMNYSRKR